MEIRVILHKPPLNPTFYHMEVLGKKIEVSEDKFGDNWEDLVNLALQG